VPLEIKMPAIEIAGLCLPLKPQKERGQMHLLIATEMDGLQLNHIY
jgi:hypothetical protein